MAESRTSYKERMGRVDLEMLKEKNLRSLHLSGLTVRGTKEMTHKGRRLSISDAMTESGPVRSALWMFNPIPHRWGVGADSALLQIVFFITSVRDSAEPRNLVTFLKFNGHYYYYYFKHRNDKFLA